MASKVIDTEHSLSYPLFLLHPYPKYFNKSDEFKIEIIDELIITQKLILAFQYTRSASYLPIFIYQCYILSYHFILRYLLKYYNFFPATLQIKWFMELFPSYCSYRWESI